MLNQIDMEYKRICTEILYKGVKVTGRDNLEYIYKFGQSIKIDVSRGFPALTLRKLPIRNLFREFVWDLQGGYDVEGLGKAQHFWSMLADENGNLCNSYGQNWRNWANPQMLPGYEWQKHRPPNTGFDQIRWILDRLKNEPTNRRLILQTHNPSLISRIPPCHPELIFSSDGSYLDVLVIARSNDLAFGVPLDIFRYATLLQLFAQKSGLFARELHLTSSNNHIYCVNKKDIEEMIRLDSKGKCKLKIHNIHKDIDDLTDEDFELIGYQSHPSRKLVFAG